MLSNYANQSLTLKTKASVNEYNESVYTSSTIKARFQYERKLVRNENGENVFSNANIYTKASIKEDDVIVFDGKEWTIMFVSNHYDLNGNLSFYKGVL